MAGAESKQQKFRKEVEDTSHVGKNSSRSLGHFAIEDYCRVTTAA